MNVMSIFWRFPTGAPRHPDRAGRCRQKRSQPHLAQDGEVAQHAEVVGRSAVQASEMAGRYRLANRARPPTGRDAKGCGGRDQRSLELRKATRFEHCQKRPAAKPAGRVCGEIRGRDMQEEDGQDDDNIWSGVLN